MTLFSLKIKIYNEIDYIGYFMVIATIWNLLKLYCDNVEFKIFVRALLIQSRPT